MSLLLSISEGKLPSLVSFSISAPLPVIRPQISGVDTFIFLLSFPMFYSSILIRYPHPRYFAKHIINRRPRCSCLVLDHSIHADRHSYSSININISIIFHIQPVSIHPYCLINIIPPSMALTQPLPTQPTPQHPPTTSHLPSDADRSSPRKSSARHAEPALIQASSS